MDNNEVIRAFRKAKISLMGNRKAAFISTLLFNLELKWSDEVPTAGVNKTNIIVNPDWFLSLTPKQRIGLLCHEAGHIALMHEIRVGSRDRTKYNIAGDHVINLMCLEMGLELPEGGMCDSQYAGMTTEQVYDLLPDDPEETSQMTGDLMESEGEPDMSPKEAQALKKDIESLISKAAIAERSVSREAGSCSAELDRMIDNLLNPKVPWESVFRHLLTSMSKEDYSTSRFNRRFLPEFYLPTLYSESMGAMNIYMDTSGSISARELSALMTEVRSIVHTMKPQQTNLYTFDHELYKPITLSHDFRIEQLRLKGGGGTSIEPVVEDIENTKPEIAVIFTDGYFNEAEYSKISRYTNLFWLIYDQPNREFSHGKVIHFEDHK